MSLYLSKVRLKRDPSIDALARQLLPDETGQRAQATHRLIWSIFAGDPEATRDFLYREIEPGSGLASRSSFMVLSHRPPAQGHALLDIETKDFAPTLAAGDRLGFMLRANATVRRKGNGVSKRHDVVMDALRTAPGKRAGERLSIIATAGRTWLEAQGARYGFVLPEAEDRLRIDGYDRLTFPRLGRKGAISTLDFSGTLELRDPALFMDRLSLGFGHAKAYGCGLMLIRRI